MTTIKKVKTALNFIKKGGKFRKSLQYIKVDESGLTCTDLETYVLIKDTFDLTKGYQYIDTLGLITSVEHDEELEATFDNIHFKHDDTSMGKYTLENLNTKELQHMLKFASKDETRLYLNCVAIKSNKLVGCDGHTMHYQTLEKESNSHDYLMPRTGLEKLVRLLKCFKLKYCTINLCEDWAIIDNDSFTVKLRLIQREYPRIDTLIPKKWSHELLITKWEGFKEIKPLLNDRTYAVELHNIGGDLVLKFPLHPNESYIIGECDISLDDGYSIGFNAKYIDRAANGDKQFTIKLNTNLNPCEINGSIVMPLKL